MLLQWARAATVFETGYFDSNRCWFKRVRTLQEIVDGAITGGDTGDIAMVDEEIQTEFNERLKSLRKM